MRIVVLINQILNPAGVVVRRDKERIFVNVEEYIIAPGDKNALEAALQIKDAEPNTEVIAVSLGPSRTDDALREALAMGADAAYLVSGKALDKILSKGVDKLDEPATARILAVAVDQIGADLVIAGQEGQLGPRLAELLDLAQITDAQALSATNGRVQATRRWGEGYAVVTAPLPALVTIAPGINQPRYPHGARIMNAYREWEVSLWGAAELGIDVTALTPLMAFRGQSIAPPLEVGELIRGDPAEAAQELVALLKSQKVITFQETLLKSEGG